MNNEKNEVYEIDLLQMVATVLKKWWLVFFISIIGAFGFFGYSYMFIEPVYEASALLYVNSSATTTLSNISISDLNASKSLVSTYSVILKSRLTLEEVIQRTGVGYSYERLVKMISAEAVNDTEIFSVTVKSTNPVEAKEIANAIVQVLPEKISYVIKGSSVTEVDLAVTPTDSIYPSYSKNAIIGFLLGFLVSVAGIIIIDVFVKDQVYQVDWLRQTFKDDIPVLGTIPDVTAKGNGKGKYYSKYAKNGYRAHGSNSSASNGSNYNGTEKRS